MPTYQRLPRFDQDWRSLGPPEQQRFRAAVARFVEDLEAGRSLRPGLRVKGVQGAGSIMEMTFAPDGRATWEFGDEVNAGQVHIVWRRIGTHGIFRSPEPGSLSVAPSLACVNAGAEIDPSCSVTRTTRRSERSN